jgi:broad specificity phosphatase PhoE
MKWPESVTLLRHGRSLYNDLRRSKYASETYLRFVRLFRASEYGQPTFSRSVLLGTWPSPELRSAAVDAFEVVRDLMQSSSDIDMPLTSVGELQAQQTGLQLQHHIPAPSVIYYSPSRRTIQTLQHLQSAWPALKTTVQLEDDRIREQEHGLKNLYGGDWRLYRVFNPHQALLYDTEGPFAYRYLNGENKFDVRARVKHFMNRLVREHSGRHVMLVTHHLTILSARSVLERWTRDEFARVDAMRRPINCGVSIYRCTMDTQTGRRALTCRDNEYNMRLYDCPTGDEAGDDGLDD